MLTLTLLRHAKSSWGNPGVRDFDRPLNERGREAAPLMGAVMRREGLRPDLILCSPAVRTRQTLDLARGTHPALGEANYEDRLYHGAPETLLRAVRETPATVAHVMLVGHNPGLQQLAVRLAGGGSESRRRALAEKLPTGALVVLAFDAVRWADIRPGAGRLLLFARPRDEIEKGH